MKRGFLVVCAAALLAASCTSGDNAQTPRVIVLGIDGGTWTVIEPMMEAGELPNLKKLCDTGIHGILESRPPILSPVVWTTIFTGFGFSKHGIKDWKTSQSVNRRVNAIWEIMRDQKQKVDVFNVPGTWPADPIPGVMLSGFPLSGATMGGNTGEFLTPEQLDQGKVSGPYRDNTGVIKDAVMQIPVGKWTPWLPARIATRPSFRGTLRAMHYSDDNIYVSPVYRTDDGLVASEPKNARSEVSAKIGEPYIPEGPGWSRWDQEHVADVLYDHLDQVFSIQSKGAELYAGDDWRLFLYVMTFVDRISHPYWGYAHPDNFPNMDREKAKKYENFVANAYRRSDEELGKILAKVKGTPYVVIVSDHGFQSSTDPEKAIGTHNPDGIYIVSGPKITQKTGLPKFIEDVTPTLLYLLNMPVGQDMDGKVFSEVVEMVGRPPSSIPTWEKNPRASTDKPVDKSTWESLRGLGYVDGAAPRAQDKTQGPGAAGAGAATRPGQSRAPGSAPGAMPPGMAGTPGIPGTPPSPPSRNGGVPAAPTGQVVVPNALDNWPEDKGQAAPAKPAPANPGKPADSGNADKKAGDEPAAPDEKGD
ncbi:MAG TPA: alkaline phosphatase family protein [Candidatus Binatia bacterium]|jgi:hypothetical protein